MNTGPPRLALTTAVVAATVAFVGFLTGTDDSRERAKLSDASLTKTSPGVVPTYGMLGSSRRGVNSTLYDGAFERLRAGLPALTATVVRTGGIDALRTARAERRAFDGAPPTIPHVIDQRGYPACLACHEHGAALGDLIAPAMSHEPLLSCIQCHVPQANPVSLGRVVIGSSFVGLSSPGPGSRAWQGAPPTIPHRTQMRERCESCHGVGGLNALRTTHPWRQACTQCHVSGEVDTTRPWFPTLGAPQ